MQSWCIPDTKALIFKALSNTMAQQSRAKQPGLLFITILSVTAKSFLVCSIAFVQYETRKQHFSP